MRLKGIAQLKRDIAVVDPKMVHKMDLRLASFAKVRKGSPKLWFSELCFCLLTSNAKSATACAVQEDLGYDGFMTLSFEELRDKLLFHKHRFHNVKAERIIRAREHKDIKKIISAFESVYDARKWLVDNVYGFGYKEASHLLRNVGYDDIAILDRHVLALMLSYGWIPEIPKTMNEKKYLMLEKIFLEACSKVSMSPAKLDYYFWYWKAGDVLK